MTRFEIILLLILIAGWTLDSMSSGLISGTLSLIIEEFELSRGEAGALLSSWLIGMLIGAALMGYLGDVIGRKNVMIIALTLLGLFTWLSLIAWNPLQLAIFRILAGMGAASYMVMASTLLSEYAPSKFRGSMVALLESSWALGWLISIVLARVIAPYYGWRAVYNSALAVLALIPIVTCLVPESLRYLVIKGRVEKARELSKRHKIKVDLKSFKVAEKISVKDLFRGVYGRRTLMLWTHWFCIVLAYWGIFLWLPKILESRDISFIRSLEYAIIMTIAQIPGYLSAVALIDKIGRKHLLASYMALAGLGSFMFWRAISIEEVLLWGIVVSFFNLGAWGITYAYTPELYPTKLRSAGSGWANSIGRIGGIIGPYVAGLIMEATGNPLYPFLLFATVHFISAIVIYTLGEETKLKSLEEISH